MSEYRRRLADLAAKYGRLVEVTNGSRYRLVAPGKGPVFAPYSTRDFHALKNIEADLKKSDGKDK